MILSDFPVFLGVKWSKFDCKVTTKTTYTETTPTLFTFSINQPADKYAYSYADYYFTTDQGFIGRNEIKHDNGKNMSGYLVHDTDVWAYENNGVDLGTGWINYTCPNVAKAYKNVTTTYSKGSTSYGAVYADKNELPADGQLIEGSANDAYCVIRTGGTYYYYEKTI